MLLEKGCIEENDLLILDEPEIHLHPQWQLVYAELIVLLQKYFKLSVVLTTHSPYFLDAINLFSEKYGVAETTNYYLASQKERWVKMENVTDNIELIYQKMATPVQILDTLRYELNNQ
jgi:predicted ATP-dependent endonuclease of OLD family